ncbi:MAG: HIT family protein [Acholeplasmatales bacterium]|nr:HIT family protein [Acholeplasmatales bacterium]
MCIFCEIIKGNIPSKKVYEDDKVLAILDISQITKGHTLVLPKKHFDNFLDIDEEYSNAVFNAARKVTKMINNAYKPLGFNIINNCGETAGQSVMHFHVHVVPRYNKEDLVMQHADNSNKFDLDSIVKDIKG